MLCDRLGLSERRACEIAGQHRSTQRHEPKVAPDDEALCRRLRRLSASKPRWGYRRAHGHLLSEGWHINRKRVQRIWREEGLRVPARKRKRRRLGESTAEGGARLRATHPGHLWALDFQHDATSDGRELKFLNIVDEFTREALAIEVDRAIDADETVARVLREWCEGGSTSTAYIDPGAPWQNAWVESLNARFRDEVLDVEEFANLAEARFLAADWQRDYNNEHPHSALGMMTPSRFAASWQRIEATNGSVNPELSYGVDR